MVEGSFWSSSEEEVEEVEAGEQVVVVVVVVMDGEGGEKVGGAVGELGLRSSGIMESSVRKLSRRVDCELDRFCECAGAFFRFGGAMVGGCSGFFVRSPAD